MRFCKIDSKSLGIKIIRFIVALALLFLMLHLGKIISQLIPIGISDSIWGLLILFILLVSKIIKTEWVMPASKPLLRYMALFFLPICLSIVEQTEILKRNINVIVFGNLFSTIIALVIIGLLAQWLFKEEQNNE